jgi:hypothetical protein
MRVRRKRLRELIPRSSILNKKDENPNINRKPLRCCVRETRAVVSRVDLVALVSVNVHCAVDRLLSLRQQVHNQHHHLREANFLVSEIGSSHPLLFVNVADLVLTRLDNPSVVNLCNASPRQRASISLALTSIPLRRTSCFGVRYIFRDIKRRK